MRLARQHIVVTLLREELDRLLELGSGIRIWWRDDDADVDCQGLRRVSELARRFAVVLAVIPGRLDVAIGSVVNDSNIRVVQHGWAHVNRALDLEQKSEYPDRRDIDAALSELKAGRILLEKVFGDRFIPILVPPWHHCSQTIAGRLPSIGFHGISSGVNWDRPTPGLIDVCLDAIDWTGGARALRKDELMRNLVGLLRYRRYAGLPVDLPIGFLTHHKHLDESAFEVLVDFFEELAGHAAVTWLEPAEVFAPMLSHGRG